MTTRLSAFLLGCTVTLVLTDCGGDGAQELALASAAVTQQLVFMWAADGHVSPAGPDVDYEIALINLDGSHFEQLTSDGEQKFLPHLSPMAANCSIRNFSSAV